MGKKRVLFACSEVYPFAKTGGLADVAHSLPRELGKTFEMTVAMPLYRFMDAKRFGIEPIGEPFTLPMGGKEYTVRLHGCRYQEIEYRFVETPILSDREFPYGPPECGYEDNALRFGLFSYALVHLIREIGYEIAHLNDWQCALAALLIKQDTSLECKTLFTIHNLAYQGVFEHSVLDELGIGHEHFTMEGLEFYGKVNLMKAGIAYADTVTTVSPTYAKEILTTEFGCGLEGFLHHHRTKLVGIVNGIDPDHFSPLSDQRLFSPYESYKGKTANKKALLSEVGLKGVSKPLFVFVGRFTGQKGVDLLIESLPAILAAKCNVIVLGDGEKRYFDSLETLAAAHSNLLPIYGYDETLSHRLYAAADFLLMPSLFEPCGLNQLIAIAYGTIPIVHRVGGLADTVKPIAGFDPDKNGGFGIVFKKPVPKALSAAVEEAMLLYTDTARLRTVASHNMMHDVSWNSSAKRYAALYRKH